MNERRILMIAFHFPPLKASSGLQRTLTFSRYLADDHGWVPTVLSAHARAYASTSTEQLASVGANVQVVRAFALDAARHFSIANRYPNWTSLPDRWANWWFAGVLAGLRVINRQRPDVIWSTYPIATAHLIAHSLARISGIPWVADFRDSMTEDGYPESKSQWKSYRTIEKKTVNRSSAVVFAAPGARDMYQERYPQVPQERWHVIENGFDAEEFPQARNERDSRAVRIQLLHSGLLYRSERNPEAFFVALAMLKNAGEITAKTLRVTLRASGDDRFYEDMVRQYGIHDIVEIMPAIGYSQALEEMTQAGGLLIFQAASCNHQIPAKLYEYFHAGRPILALTDAAGDTATKIREAGRGLIANLEDSQDIAVGLRKLLQEAKRPQLQGIDTERYSRQARAAELAKLLQNIT